MQSKWLVLIAVATVAASVGNVAAGTDALKAGVTTIEAGAQKPSLRTVSVPLSISNSQDLLVANIPLRFGHPGDGVELREVRFDVRFSDFDLRISRIDNVNKTVLIGLIPMAFNASRRELPSGDGPLAELVFEITDPSLQAFTVEAHTQDKPRHRLQWVYNDWSGGTPEVRAITPDFAPVRVALLAASAGGQLPVSYTLNQNYPNPFNPSTEIAFALPQAGRVKLDVYNVLGQNVTTLLDEYREAGSYQMTWDGTDRGGASVPSGVYFYTIHAGDFTAAKKMILLK